MKHKRSFTEILAIITWMIMLFIVVSATTSCRIRKVETQKSKSEFSIDSSSVKSETKQEEKKIKTDSSGKEKTSLASEKQVISFPDSVKIDQRSGVATFYTHGKEFRASSVSSFQNEKESLKTTENALKTKEVKNEDSAVRIDSTRVDHSKNTKTSGVSFGGSIAIVLVCLAIGGVLAWKSKP